MARFDKEEAPAITVDYESMTIEHLASQSLIGTADFSEEIVGQLGNLILVSEALNNQLKDKPFPEKKHILLAEGYALPAEISAATAWTSKDIRSRTEQMAIESYTRLWKI